MVENSRASGLKFLVLGLLVFLTLGMDLFVVPIDKLIWGNQFDISTFFSSSWYVLITHWSIVIVLWIIGGVLIFKWLKKKEYIEEVISTKWSKELVLFIIIAVVTGVLFNVVESFIFSEPFLPQFFREYKSFSQMHGSMGALVWLFQNIYYLIESMLVVLLLALMQYAGEIWFKNDRIPYGGFGLLFTWGIGHIFHGIPSALWICGFSLFFGYLFIKANKYWWPSLLFVWIMFFV